jgi:hypothetical protein
MVRYLFIVTLLLCSVRSIALPPGAGAEPPPPGSLPPILLECDINPGVGTTCAPWIWDGKHYNARWDVGFTGQMTVESAGPSLVLRRVDSAGPTAGLSGKYIGKWDGHQVSDAAFSFTWGGKSVTETWSAFAAVAPATCERGNHIKSWLPSPITAWVLQRDGPRGGDPDVADVRTVSLIPDAPNRAYNISQLCTYAFDAFHPYSTHVSTAVFADGSAFGDRKQIANFEAARAREARQYLHVETRLCDLARQGMTMDQIFAAFDSEHLGFDPALDLLHRDFRKPPRTPQETVARINAVIKSLGTKRTAILDPVRDEHGNLYINDAAPNPTCALP